MRGDRIFSVDKKISKQPFPPSLFQLAGKNKPHRLDVPLWKWMNPLFTTSIVIVPFPHDDIVVRCLCPYEGGLAIGCSDGYMVELSIADMNRKDAKTPIADTDQNITRVSATGTFWPFSPFLHDNC